MKQNYLLLLFAVCSLASCGNGNQKPLPDSISDSQQYDCIIPPPDSVTELIYPTPELINECYRYDKGEEHKSISINIVQDSAWGNFQWHIEGKDGVKGDFSGKFHGDTLWIIYQAMMEGNLIPREVAFLRKGDKLYEAQGTQKEGPKGVHYYQHRKMLEYSDPEPMVKGPCM